jgi:hypothetical protein
VAPVLQCPDCGTKHPLREVPNAGTFPCKGCGRSLKVPEFVPRSATTSAPAPAPVVPAPAPASAPPRPPEPPARPPVDQTRALPVIEQNRAPAREPAPAPAPTSGDRPVPVWIRLLLWVVAVPLSFFIVFLVARGFGWFTTTQLSDVFLANSTSRFWPLVRLLPFVALLTAVLVQGGVVFLSKRRVR